MLAQSGESAAAMVYSRLEARLAPGEKQAERERDGEVAHRVPAKREGGDDL